MGLNPSLPIFWHISLRLQSVWRTQVLAIPHVLLSPSSDTFASKSSAGTGASAAAAESCAGPISA